MSTIAVVPRPHYRTQSVPTDQRSRVPAIDLFRYVAALAVVWIHITHDVASQASVQPARLAVPFFCALSGYLTIGSILKSPSQTFLAFARSRLIRLYVPFVAWSCIYLLFKFAKKCFLPDQQSDLPGWEFFLVGGAYHLWFFPFLAVGSLFAYAIAYVRKWESTVGYLPTLLFAAGAAIAFSPNPCDPNQAWSYMWDATPSLLWGIGIGYWAFHPNAGVIEVRTRLTCLRPWAFAIAMCMAWCAIRNTLWFGRSNFFEGVGGVSVLVGCLLFPGSGSANVSRTCNRLVALATKLGALSMGLYCVHLLVLKVVESIATKYQVPMSVTSVIAIWMVTAAVSTLVAWCLAQWNRTRWLVT